MLPSWDFMLIEDRVRMVRDFFPTLGQDVVQQIIGEWAKGEYDNSWTGEQRAIGDLMKMFRWASMSPEQQAQEKARIAALVKEHR